VPEAQLVAYTGRQDFEADELVGAQRRHRELLLQQVAQRDPLQRLGIELAQRGELGLRQEELAEQVELAAHADHALDADERSRCRKKFRPRPFQAHALDRKDVEVEREVFSASVAEPEKAHVGRTELAARHEGAPPVLAHDQPAVRQLLERLLHGADAGPEAGSELLFRRQAVALAQRTGLDARYDRVTDTLELGRHPARPRSSGRSG